MQKRKTSLEHQLNPGDLVSMPKLSYNLRRKIELQILFISGMGMIENSNKKNNNLTEKCKKKDHAADTKRFTGDTERKIDQLISNIDEKPGSDQKNEKCNTNKPDSNDDIRFHEIYKEDSDINNFDQSKKETKELFEIKKTYNNEPNNIGKVELSSDLEKKVDVKNKFVLPKLRFSKKIKKRTKENVQDIKKQDNTECENNSKKKIKFKINKSRKIINFSKNKTEKEFKDLKKTGEKQSNFSPRQNPLENKNIKPKLELKKVTIENKDKVQKDTEMKKSPLSNEKIMEENTVLDEDIRKVLTITDELLGNLPENVIDEFVNSEKFTLYEKVINKYKIK